jgi:hypothetical protein
MASRAGGARERDDLIDVARAVQRSAVTERQRLALIAG